MKIKVWVAVDFIIWPDEGEVDITQVKVFTSKKEAQDTGFEHYEECELDISSVGGVLGV